jgi:ketosteroid isomerase-like protein
MLTTQKLIIEDACTAWEVGNSTKALARFADDVAFSVHAPDEASFVGGGQGKAELARRLGRYLDNIQVMYFEPLQITEREDGLLQCLVRFVYRHRQKRLEIEGSMRTVWRFGGDKVVRLDIFYDAPLMSAFYGLVDNAHA